MTVESWRQIVSLYMRLCLSKRKQSVHKYIFLHCLREAGVNSIKPAFTTVICKCSYGFNGQKEIVFRLKFLKFGLCQFIALTSVQMTVIIII